MPILDEFKPDLIINSAGQDNHYSDPITNMKFTARGYAVLNQRLAPDLAVLEGGYSIETALPYINTGIILAMAGMDFSHIKEPDYDAESQKQPANITAYLEKLKDATFHHWNNRHALREQVYPEQEFHKRSMDVYYDTDGIREHINETVRSCPDCGGTVVIDSRCDDTRNHVLAVQIPRYACDPCRSYGEEQYANATPGRYTQVFLQDKDNDRYLSK